MNTKENNILIGLFEAQFEEYESDRLRIIDDLTVKKFSPKDYHKHWDLLMPIVENIGEEILNKPFDETLSHLTEIYGDNIWNIQALYEAVVEFIKWYNENKKIKNE